MPTGARTAQGIEAFVGVHCVGAWLLTQLLLPQLRNAARESSEVTPPRVIWTSSLLIEQAAPKNGMDLNKLEDGYGDGTTNYAAAKVGAWALSREFARRYGQDGILSVCQNPGNVVSGAYAGAPWVLMQILKVLVLYPPKMGAYTELYAGFSPDVTMERNGAYIIPFGRIREESKNPLREIKEAMKPAEEGGKDLPKHFWDWCDAKCKDFL
jgi:NAD(P)-dependent dehydrogenase (short-subunit alcohol dehydrogenase family)